MYQYNCTVKCYRYATLVLDEMKIREDLVFKKDTGEIIGFVDFGQGSFDDRFTELKSGVKKDHK